MVKPIRVKHGSEKKFPFKSTRKRSARKMEEELWRKESWEVRRMKQHQQEREEEKDKEKKE